MNSPGPKKQNLERHLFQEETDRQKEGNLTELWRAWNHSIAYVAITNWQKDREQQMYDKASVRSVFVCFKTKCIIYGDAIRQMEDRIDNENDVGWSRSSR